MKKMFIVPLLATFLLARPAYAACTYAGAATDATRVVTCTATTEAAPTLVTEGVSLANRRGFTVIVEAAGAMTTGGTFQAYVWNIGSGSWVRAPDWDVTAQAITKQAWPGFMVSTPQGRVDYRPTGTGAQNTTLYLITSP